MLVDSVKLHPGPHRINSCKTKITFSPACFPTFTLFYDRWKIQLGKRRWRRGERWFFLKLIQNSAAYLKYYSANKLTQAWCNLWVVVGVSEKPVRKWFVIHLEEWKYCRKEAPAFGTFAEHETKQQVLRGRVLKVFFGGSWKVFVEVFRRNVKVAIRQFNN